MNDDSFQYFRDEGFITEVIRPLKHGKEASVHLCRATPRAGCDLAALKIYHPLDRRDFRDESVYRDGEFIKERRIRTALDKKTRFGRQVQGSLWVDREWETLNRLVGSAVTAPAPIAYSGSAILMSYIGDSLMAAPRLHELRRLDPEKVASLWDQIQAAIGAMLYRDMVHADLSAYNILVWSGEAVFIDFPQTVDAKKNQHAEGFLARDVRRVGDWFERHGLYIDWEGVASDLWTAWLHADLLPDELRPGRG